MASPAKKFPGFGLPVDHEVDSPLPTALDRRWTSDGVTVREQRMMDFIGKILDKPDWDTKVFDDEIVARWRSEANALLPTDDGDVYLSQQMFDFVRSNPSNTRLWFGGS